MRILLPLMTMSPVVALIDNVPDPPVSSTVTKSVKLVDVVVRERLPVEFCTRTGNSVEKPLPMKLLVLMEVLPLLTKAALPPEAELMNSSPPKVAVRVLLLITSALPPVSPLIVPSLAILRMTGPVPRF